MCYANHGTKRSNWFGTCYAPTVSYTPSEFDDATLGLRTAFGSEPHLRFGAVAVWYTSPAGVVVQLAEPVRCTVEVASWIVGPVFEELDRRLPRTKGLIFVFDLSLMQGRTHAARSVFLSKVRQVGKRFGEALFVPPRVASAALRQSMGASVLLARAIGIKVEVIDSAVYAVRARGLRALP